MRRFFSTLSDIQPVELSLRLTLINLLLSPFGHWSIRPFILMLSGLALASTPILRSPPTWFLLFGLIVARLVMDWPRPDNHKYLLAYWCLSVALALRPVVHQQTLAKTSRLLLGLVFALATIWKAFLSPDYLDERFFRVTFLTDDRFADSVKLLSGITAEQLEQNRLYLQPLAEGETWFDPPILQEPPRFRFLTKAATYGTLGIEALIAILFLTPFRQRIFQNARHASLLGFCILTYAMAPVPGFGWLLLVMGLSMCRQDQHSLQYFYVVVFFLVLLYAEIPWAKLLVETQDT